MKSSLVRTTLRADGAMNSTLSTPLTHIVPRHRSCYTWSACSLAPCSSRRNMPADLLCAAGWHAVPAQCMAWPPLSCDLPLASSCAGCLPFTRFTDLHPSYSSPLGPSSPCGIRVTVQVHGCGGRLLAMIKPNSAVGRWPIRHPAAADLHDKQRQRSQYCAATAVADAPTRQDTGQQAGKLMGELCTTGSDTSSDNGGAMLCATSNGTVHVQRGDHTVVGSHCRHRGTWHNLDPFAHFGWILMSSAWRRAASAFASIAVKESRAANSRSGVAPGLCCPWSSMLIRLWSAGCK
jgi:hypothetical protein